jgi:predicted  nucleic acid-binding Zn-ribbon protein
VPLPAGRRDEEPTLKADPFAQLKLLDLQAADSELDQLEHRLTTLPEHAALAELGNRKEQVTRDHGLTETEVSDLTREQRKADADVEQVKGRLARDQQRLDTGVVTDPKQIQAIQHGIETLHRRISDLEDEELEVMERLEEAQGRLEALAAELAEIQTRTGEQAVARDTAASGIAEQRAKTKAERDSLAADLPADLLALYDRLRTQLDGVGVGALHQKRCGGCRLEVGAADLARMVAAPSDEVLRCEECNRILVRTAESGI